MPRASRSEANTIYRQHHFRQQTSLRLIANPNLALVNHARPEGLLPAKDFREIGSAHESAQLDDLF
jgi:hypothetical protein